MTEQLLPLTDVEAAIGFKRSHIYDLIKQGRFPPPVAIGTCRRWKQSDIQAWIAEKIQQSTAVPVSLKKSPMSHVSEQSRIAASRTQTADKMPEGNRG